MVTKKFVVKSNDLVEARYRLSLQESHVVLWLLTQIQQDDEDFKTHKLKVEDFAKMVGLNAQGQYGEMQKITENLMRRVLKIKEKNTEGDKELLQVAWLSSAKYHYGKGYVSLCFDPQLKPYLLQLKSHFTKINIADTMKFKSIYAVRIFELLVQHSSIRKREISIEALRNYCGIEEGEYVLYGNLKKNIITPAKREINEKTDFIVDYKEIKKSRKVDKIDWSINKKQSEEVVAKPSAQSKPLNVVPINYESCRVPEVIEFCRHQEPTLRRDLIDYLLNATSFTLKDETVYIGFSKAFFRDRCDTEEIKRALAVFFKVKAAEVR